MLQPFVVKCFYEKIVWNYLSFFVWGYNSASRFTSRKRRVRPHTNNNSRKQLKTNTSWSNINLLSDEREYTTALIPVIHSQSCVTHQEKRRYQIYFRNTWFRNLCSQVHDFVRFSKANCAAVYAFSEQKMIVYDLETCLEKIYKMEKWWWHMSGGFCRIFLNNNHVKHDALKSCKMDWTHKHKEHCHSICVSVWIDRTSTRKIVYHSKRFPSCHDSRPFSFSVCDRHT